MTAISIGLGSSGDDDVVQIGECKRCGDCATGCNHDAKNSLDTNLLARARKARARIFTGATVLRIERGEDAIWQLHVAHTDDATRKRQGAPAVLRARKLILAAGTFGSTEILLRSRDRGLALSAALGSRFSGNGDVLAFGTSISGLDVTHTGLAYRDGRGVLRVLHAPLSGGVVQVSRGTLAQYVAGLRGCTGILAVRSLPD